ncbi:hypothetical protein MKK58_01165 [Methylobacterium sp. J-078]|uniref:hypothetical protein n=1 Tax=Methylobacterium sp. J-078 TaxID=2836657 RepID=UPI001FB9218E|nr:hypothetical protein [Methylobacterium sp. J-078]MCJ2043165.1 hypothetical protein [Methylobacterium sp. J-078]
MSVDLAVYIRPRPTVVADVWDYCSPEAAQERWHWLKPHQLVRLACEGRRLRRVAVGAPARHSQARSTTPVEDAAVVEAFRRTGTVADTGVETGQTYWVVMRILREAGVTVPPVDRYATAAKAAETKRQRRIAA